MMPWRLRAHRAQMDRRIRPVRAMRDEIQDLLDAAALTTVDELLDNDEPNEALLTMAWEIAGGQLDVSLAILQAIEEGAGDKADLPADLTGKSGPPVRRTKR